MRQLFMYWPPRMVSAKWTRQLSRSSTLPMAAATPPSAITVCALPSSDFVTTPVLAPFADASIAARNPAPPAPTTRTSYSCIGYSGINVLFGHGGRTPWSAADALVGLFVASRKPARGPAADQGVRPPG